MGSLSRFKRRSKKCRKRSTFVSYDVEEVDSLTMLLRKSSACTASVKYWFSMKVDNPYVSSFESDGEFNQVLNSSPDYLNLIGEICKDVSVQEMKTFSDMYLYPYDQMYNLEKTLVYNKSSTAIRQLKIMHEKQRRRLRPNPRKRIFPDMVHTNDVAKKPRYSGFGAETRSYKRSLINDCSTATEFKQLNCSPLKSLSDNKMKNVRKTIMPKLKLPKKVPSSKLLISLTKKNKVRPVVIRPKLSSPISKPILKKTVTSCPEEKPNPDETLKNALSKSASSNKSKASSKSPGNDVILPSLPDLPSCILDFLKDIRYRSIDKEDKENREGFWIREIPQRDFVLLNSRSSRFCKSVNIKDISGRGLNTARMRYDVFLVHVPTGNISQELVSPTKLNHSYEASSMEEIPLSLSLSSPITKVSLTEIHEPILSPTIDSVPSILTDDTKSFNVVVDLDEGTATPSIEMIMSTGDPSAHVMPALISHHMPPPPPIRPIPRAPPAQIRHVAKVYTKKSTVPSILKHNRAKLLTQMGAQTLITNFNVGATNGYSAPLSARIYPTRMKTSHDGKYHFEQFMHTPLTIKQHVVANMEEVVKGVTLPQRWISALNATQRPHFATPSMRVVTFPTSHNFVRPPAMAANPRLLTASLRHQMYPTPITSNVTFSPSPINTNSHIVPPVAVVKKSTWQVSKTERPASMHALSGPLESKSEAKVPSQSS